MNPRPGEVSLADLGIAAKTRPVVVVSRYDENPPREMTALPFLRSAGVANVQGIGSMPVKRLESRLGILPTDVMDQLKKALRFALDLD